MSDIGKNNHELRQIDSEGHAKYGYATSDMKRDILINKGPRVVKCTIEPYSVS